MSKETLRGSRLGSQSLESDTAIDYSNRKSVEYDCVACGTTTSLIFAVEADAPYTWDCSGCPEQATLRGGTAPTGEDIKVVKESKTPFEMLLERRSRDELEEILKERLAYLRQRRGAGLEDLEAS